MERIKHTKNELKAQREALERYEHFLPMLQLKKIQLQLEVQSIDAKLADKQKKQEQLFADLGAWIKLFSEPVAIEDYVALEAIRIEEGNIAGVNIPVLKEVKIKISEPDLFATPTWFDEALDVLKQLIRQRVEREILEEQRKRIGEELRTTAQRVNLFEKVKIPECTENIRVIKIFLGDEQTAAVVRGKIAKKRAESYAEVEAA
jgi:V/A-type H+/Na+-transporting ATPase subunit D